METYYGYVKTPQDAILLFEACRCNYLSRIQRRLSEKERSAIRSGSVFVWDEREAGMRRWTDGKSWSASRVSGSFLTYRELESKRKTNSRNSNNPHDLSSEDTDSSESYANKKLTSTDQCRYKHGGLVKQSFSITTTNHQKLHLICYYTKSDVVSEKLPIPSQDEKLKGIPIPKGVYPETSSVDSGGHGHNHGHYAPNGHNHGHPALHHHHHHHHHHHTHSHPGFNNGDRMEGSVSPNPYWTLPHPHPHHHHLHHQQRLSDSMQVDSHSACSTPSISSSPSTEDDFEYHRRQHSGSSLPHYPPAHYIQSNESGGYIGTAPINIPSQSRFTFPSMSHLPYPASYPPPSAGAQALVAQDIPWEKIRNSEDQRQLNAIYTTLKL